MIFFCVDLANRLYNEPGLFCLILYRLTAFILGLERIVARIQKHGMKNMESWCKFNWTLPMKKVENSMADISDMEIQINASIESWITRTSYRILSVDLLVPKTINCNVHIIQRMQQYYNATNSSNGRVCSSRDRITRPSQDRYILRLRQNMNNKLTRVT